MEQEANIVTTTVWKPYKLIAYILLLIGLCFFIAVNGSTYWIHSESGFRQGLWRECYNGSRVVPTVIPAIIGGQLTTPIPNREISCHKALTQPWLSACQALSIISLIIMIGGAVCVTISWFIRPKDLKRRLSTGGGALVICSAIILFIVLIVFPSSIVDADVYRYRVKWEFSWGFGLSWGVFLFQVVIGLILLCAPETKEIYFDERVI